MKIGIDARLINETGVGRYIRNLVKELDVLDTQNQYVIYLSKSSFDAFELPNGNWEKRLAEVRWHTFHEQFALPRLFRKDNLDLLHEPYFSIPILYSGKFIVTIHDLTILHFATGKATTLPYGLYLLRKLGFWFILFFGLKRASAILVPSQTTKQEIIDHFHIPAKKIHVTYEGVDEGIKYRNNTNLSLKDPYFLYVGNAYPHKNLEMLLSAFNTFLRKHTDKQNYKLVFVGKDDFFHARLKGDVEKSGLTSSVIFYSQVDDNALRALYVHAESFVFPSLMEGFGLPALEAFSLGTPVICSDIPIFHEILKDFPYYVNPNDRDDIADSFLKVKRKTLSAMEKKERDRILKKYSWKQLGIDTLQLYNSLGTPSV